MSRMPWFRMYTDFLVDHKLIGLAFEDQRHFIGVLALKSDGALDIECEPDLLDRIVAQRLWIDHAIIRDVKKRLVAAGLIDARWQPLGWNKRQMRSDGDPTAAERKRRQRAKEQGMAARDTAAATESAGIAVTEVTPVTPRSRVTFPAVTGLDEDAEPESEADSEKMKGELVMDGVDFAAWPETPSAAVWGDYLKHRRELKAAMTQTAVNRLGAEVRRAQSLGYSADDFLAECMLRGWRGGKAEWLSRDQHLRTVPPESKGKAASSRQEALEFRNREVARLAALEK